MDLKGFKETFLRNSDSVIKMAKAVSQCVCVCVRTHVCTDPAAYNHNQYEGGTLIYILYLSQVFLIASASLEVSAALLLE